MSSVYGGSFINIAAASARNVHEGCFLKPPDLVAALCARVTINGSSLVRNFRCYFEYDRSVTGSYLATRAWTYQEKLLPPRTIHFGNRGAFWECRAKIANEFLPDGFLSEFPDVNLMSVQSRRYFNFWWTHVVQFYSAANLTFESDKLPAISGVARRCYNETGRRYLAGMWREGLGEQLCWRVGKPRKRPPWCAPSWSWASINGQVHFTGRVRLQTKRSDIYNDAYLHVVDAKTTFLDGDPFGAVTGGSLHITCTGLLLAQLVEERTVKLELDNENLEGTREFHFMPDCLDDDMSGIVCLLPVFGGRSGRSHMRGDNGKEEEDDDDDDEDDDDDDNDGKHGSNKKNREQSNRDYDNQESGQDEHQRIHVLEICGIVLRKTDDGVGQFRRIGMFELWKNKPNREDLYECFLSAFKQHGSKIGKAVCAEVVENPAYPDEKYAISII